MGGPGSGDYYRWSKRTTKEELKRIDIRHMRKAGLLVSNHRGTLSWNSNGKPSGEIGYTMSKDAMILNYSFQNSSEEWEPVKQTVLISRTSCNYGGERTWLHCPICQTRVAILYMVNGLFRCRHCHNIPYSCQQEGHLDRFAERLERLESGYTVMTAITCFSRSLSRYSIDRRVYTVKHLNGLKGMRIAHRIIYRES